MQTHLPDHPVQLYLIRHGEVEERYHRVFGGSRIDMALSPLGHRHGEAVARWMKATGTRPDRIYASPMLRVQQTIAPLVAQTGLMPVILPDLREVDFGDWTGHTWEGVREKFGTSAFEWLEVLDAGGIPAGETAAVLLDRVRPCVQRILQESAHQKAVVACHGGIIRAILAVLLDLPLSRTAHFSIEYGSVTVVEIQPEKKHAVELELMNFCPLRDAPLG